MKTAESFMAEVPIYQLRIQPILVRNGSSAGPGSFADFGMVQQGCKLLPHSTAWKNETFEVPAH